MLANGRANPAVLYSRKVLSPLSLWIASRTRTCQEEEGTLASHDSSSTSSSTSSRMAHVTRRKSDVPGSALLHRAGRCAQFKSLAGRRNRLSWNVTRWPELPEGEKEKNLAQIFPHAAGMAPSP